MKQNLPWITKTILFLFIALMSCEKDLQENPQPETKMPFERKFLNAEQLPSDLKNYISQSASNTTSKSGSDSGELSNAIFVPYDIICMKDDQNITNYSISFLYDDTPENIFYNLIINVSPTGQSSKYIFKYTCDPANFENFKSHNFDFKYFVGVTEISNVSDNSVSTLTSKTNSGDEDCPKVYIPSTPNPGTNPGSGGGGTTSPGGYDTSVPGYNTPGHTGGGSPGPSTGGGSDGHDHSDCYGSNGQYWHRGGELEPPHSHKGKTAGDCPEVVPPPGYVPVNTTAAIIADLKTWITLDRFQVLFLTVNPDVLNAVYKYLNDSGADAEDRAHALTMVNAARIEEQIDGTNLDPCTKAVFDKLKNLKQGDIASMLARFAPAGSIFNINMSTGIVQNNDPNIWTQTTAVSGSNTDINMIFNQDYISGKDNLNRPTDLSVATTMAHEIIHAYLISQLEQYKSCGASGICDFPTIYDAFVQQKIMNNPTILPETHHELIANDYVNSIALTIEEFHTGQSVTSGFPRQVYLDLAWGGLKGTNIFNINYPDDPNHKNYKDRERILARIIAERKGTQYGSTSPLGTSCKN